MKIIEKVKNFNYLLPITYFVFGLIMVIFPKTEETERDRSSPSPKGRSQNRERTATLLATKRSGRRRG